MHKPLSADQIATLNDPSPMTRADKLRRWAEIVRRHKTPLQLYSGLERIPPERLVDFRMVGTAFMLAAQDPVLRAAGLRGDSVADVMKFVPLSQMELHTFSCDCGGQISNADMADRIEALAVDKTFSPGRIGRAFVAIARLRP
jgi:hypothetical protein